jgi:hypothetical protein
VKKLITVLIKSWFVDEALFEEAEGTCVPLDSILKDAPHVYQEFCLVFCMTSFLYGFAPLVCVVIIFAGQTLCSQRKHL